MCYGCAIDQRTCIGCLACTVARKTEHQVPVAQSRTWVNHIEKAHFTRDDGIVGFDTSRRIG